MRVDENFYKMYLEEMKELDLFRQTYAASHGAVSLQNEEPDVKRLVEAMGFFSARSHNAAIEQMMVTQRRLFQQHYPYLLSPLPSMMILKPEVSESCAEPVTLPVGTELTVETDDHDRAIFRTMAETKICPIVQTKCRTNVLGSGRTRIEMDFKSFYPRNGTLGKVSFGINYLNNFYTSMQLVQELKGHLKKVTVMYGDEAEAKELSATYSFGCETTDGEFAFNHPIEKVRHYFHFPRTDLFFNVDLPTGGRDWSQFKITLELDADWPKNLIVYEDTFLLSAVPVVNLNKATTVPFIYDGLKSSCTLSHPETEFKHSLHSLCSVMKVTEEGLEPLQPGILSDSTGSYELEVKKKNAVYSNELYLNFPEAFADPCTIVGEAYWFQPWFSGDFHSKMNVDLYRRNVQGVSWEICGEVVPHQDSPLGDELENFISILSLRNQERFSHDDVVFLLKVLGCDKNAFADILLFLKDIDVREGMKNNNAELVRAYIYELNFKEYPSSLEPLVVVFKERLQEFLGIWSRESEVVVM